jgi:hypothetical protein
MNADDARGLPYHGLPARVMVETQSAKLAILQQQKTKLLHLRLSAFIPVSLFLLMIN